MPTSEVQQFCLRAISGTFLTGPMRRRDESPHRVFEKVGQSGLELESVSSSKTSHLQQLPDCRVAKSGAIGDEKPPQDPDLTLIIERWEQLPEAVKTGIMAMVRASEGEGA